MRCPADEVAAADRDDDVLPADHTSWAPRLLRGHEDRTDFPARGFVVGAQHRAARTRSHRRHALAANDSVLVTTSPAVPAGLASAGQRQPFQLRVSAHVVRGLPALICQRSRRGPC
jgi:hypothetical protein